MTPRATARVPQRSWSTGFTLLEILLVITLASLILALVPASFTTVVPRVEYRAEVRQLVSALRAARGAAIRQRSEMALLLDLEQQHYRRSDTEAVTELSGKLRFEFQPAFAVAEQSPQVVIRFFADGSSSGGRFAVRAQDEIYHINVDWLTGKIDFDEQA